MRKFKAVDSINQTSRDDRLEEIAMFPAKPRTLNLASREYANGRVNPFRTGAGGGFGTVEGQYHRTEGIHLGGKPAFSEGCKRMSQLHEALGNDDSVLP